MAEMNDLELFLEVKAGNLKSFEVLFRRYYSGITRYATSMVRNSEVGEEIAQEVFMYIWEKREQIELHSALKSYLYSSAKNKCLNYIKLELPKQQSTTDLEGVGETINDAYMTLDDTELIKRRIQYAIDLLPEKCRNIFLLSRYGGLTYNEIAEDLDISVKTVENQMTIALKRLKETLSEDLKNYRIK